MVLFLITYYIFGFWYYIHTWRKHFDVTIVDLVMGSVLCVGWPFVLLINSVWSVLDYLTRVDKSVIIKRYPREK